MLTEHVDRTAHLRQQLAGSDLSNHGQLIAVLDELQSSIGALWSASQAEEAQLELQQTALAVLEALQQIVHRPSLLQGDTASLATLQAGMALLLQLAELQCVVQVLQAQPLAASIATSLVDLGQHGDELLHISDAGFALLCLCSASQTAPAAEAGDYAPLLHVHDGAANLDAAPGQHNTFPVAQRQAEASTCSAMETKLPLGSAVTVRLTRCFAAAGMKLRASSCTLQHTDSRPAVLARDACLSCIARDLVPNAGHIAMSHWSPESAPTAGPGCTDRCLAA